MIFFNGRLTESGGGREYECISYSRNNDITGSNGGMFLTDYKDDADKIFK